MAASKKSGNPAKKASSVADIKKKTSSIEELPSGIFVKLRNPGGLAAFMGPDAQGEIPNSLMPMIQKALKTGKTPDVETELLENGEIKPELLADMMKMLDNMAVRCMVDPDLQPAPKSEAERSDEILYVDELPDDDKQYIFAWLTAGVKDLETFREQRQAGVDALAGVPSPQGNTK